MARLLARERVEVAPGAVHVPDWLDVTAQRRLGASCRRWVEAAGGIRTPRLPAGGVMSVGMVGLGWHWYPYRYSRTVDDGDGAPVAPFPGELTDLGRRAVAAAFGGGDADADFEPDVALVNWYGPGARMGMHADRDERSRAPVVSLSIGDTCVFRFGNPESRGRPWTDIELESGDLFVFGGPSRLAYHGVPRVRAGTADPACGVEGGRFNVTLRVTGLGGSGRQASA